jgi:hypothetical protein
VKQRVRFALIVVALFLPPIAIVAGDVLYRTLANTADGTILSWKESAYSMQAEVRFETRDAYIVTTFKPINIGWKVLDTGQVVPSLATGDHIEVRYLRLNPGLLSTLEGTSVLFFGPIPMLAILAWYAGIFLLLAR